MAFCDWFSGFINYDMPDLHDGRVIRLDSSGIVEYELLTPLSVTGSYDDKVIVKSCPVPAGREWSLLQSESQYRVYISGNPTKFLQGHNVYGHTDMVAVINDFIKAVLQLLNVDIFTIRAILKEPVRITRLDITQNYFMDSPADVKNWLRAAAQFMTGKNQKVDNDKTLYVGKSSRRVTIKVYEKAAEMIKHKKTFNLPEETFLKLHEVASCLIRFEVTLRGMKLEDLRMNALHKVDNAMFKREYYHAIEKMNLPENLEIIKDAVFDLPHKYAGVYHLWLGGLDIRQTMPERTYYRYRKFFLDRFNLDLSMPPRDISYSSVIPLYRVISLEREWNPSEDDEHLYNPMLSIK